MGALSTAYASDSRVLWRLTKFVGRAIKCSDCPWAYSETRDDEPMARLFTGLGLSLTKKKHKRKGYCEWKITRESYSAS
jgi:hypothetical protein